MNYDILVGADGAHSQVRSKSEIPLNYTGQAYGVGAILSNEEPSEIDFSSIVVLEDCFIRKTSLPSFTFVFAQSRPSKFKKLNQHNLANASQVCGWNWETACIENGTAQVFENIEVLLQQALYFSNREKRVILIGDAAATASFFQGKGANTALQAAIHAGAFFYQFQQNVESAYDQFEDCMKSTTDALIKDSYFLFLED